jgi:hypothetical protein
MPSVLGGDDSSFDFSLVGDDEKGDHEDNKVMAPPFVQHNADEAISAASSSYKIFACNVFNESRRIAHLAYQEGIAIAKKQYNDAKKQYTETIAKLEQEYTIALNKSSDDFLSRMKFDAATLPPMGESIFTNSVIPSTEERRNNDPTPTESNATKEEEEMKEETKSSSSLVLSTAGKDYTDEEKVWPNTDMCYDVTEDHQVAPGVPYIGWAKRMGEASSGRYFFYEVYTADKMC